MTLALALSDWASNLTLSPRRQAELVRRAWHRYSLYTEHCARHWAGLPHADGDNPLSPDRRFDADEWQAWPWSTWREGFLLAEDWWRQAASGVPGLSRQHAEMVSFLFRQWLDAFSPSAIPAANPETIKATVRSCGINVLKGMASLLHDFALAARQSACAGAEEFRPGETLAMTPGRVIFRNHLMELIQYAPATERVRPEPVLIVPAWLMKYYILDLSPGNSLAGHLVAKGHTVFMISWRNPGSGDRGLGLEDYREQGLMAALGAVGTVVPDRRIHAAGYCLGGTLLAIAAATMARDGDDRLASLSFFAAQTDFTERGKLMLFIDGAQVSFLESLMAGPGYLDFGRLTGILRLLREDDMLWSGMVRNYLSGKRPPMTALKAWTLDATRLPARAHSEYLRKLVLNNDLAAGRYHAGGSPVSLRQIRAPVFSVSTAFDHIAPWRSIYGLHARTDSEITFVLSHGGHNAGIVSPPGSTDRHFQTAGPGDFTACPDPDTWRAQAPRRDGSWWPFWQRWLADRSGPSVPPPGMGAPERGLVPLCDAPGEYVLMP